MKNILQLIVGLGNPGPDYEDTRHNAGAQFVEELARNNGISLSTDSKFHGLCGRGIVADQEIRLLIPTTFMNRSGQAVAAAMHFYKLEPADLLVAHDELDLPPGVARYKTGGGHGGHNGLRDIISALGNNRDFHRLRLGIGHPGHSDKVVGYVLNKAPASERELVSASIQEAIRTLPYAMRGNWTKAMNQLHCFNGSVSP